MRGDAIAPPGPPSGRVRRVEDRGKSAVAEHQRVRPRLCLSAYDWSE